MVRINSTHRLAALPALALLAAAPALAQNQPPAQAPAQPGTPPAAAAPVTPAPSPLADIPGVTIRHYDVTGVTIEEMRASIEAQRPRDATTGVAIPSEASWNIGTNVQRATTGTQCRIVGANVTFTSEVLLPRLVAVEAVPPPVLAHWQAYVRTLEQHQADYLRRPLQRISEVQRAVLASSCEGAAAAANRAIAEITTPPPPPPPPATPAPATPTPQQ